MKIVNQFPFEFGDAIFEIYWTDERMFVLPIRQISEALGLSPAGFLQRVRRDPILEKHLYTVRAPVAGADGKSYEVEVICVSIKRLHYMMGTLNVDRIKPELRDRMILFKEQLADAVYAFFRSGVFSEDIRAELDATLPPEEQEFHRRMDEAAALKAQMDAHDVRFTNVEQRLAALETRLMGTDFINFQQSRQYLDAVGVLGDMLKERKSKMASPYAVIHAGVKREFKVPSYQLIAENQFSAVMEYLAAWWKRDAPDLELPQIFVVRQDRLL